MIVEYTRYRVPPDRHELFVNAYEAAADYLSASAHCLAFELSHCVEDHDRYVLRIEWQSTEGHLEGFRKEPGFPEFRRLVEPFAGDIEEMNHYELTEVVHWK